MKTIKKVAFGIFGAIAICVGLSGLFTDHFAQKNNDGAQSATMERAIDYLRDLDYEQMIAIGSDGKVLFSLTQCEEDGVKYEEEQMEICRIHKGEIVIHNHVSDVPPSMADILATTELDCDRMVVVTPNWIYHIVPPETGWKTDDEIIVAIDDNVDLLEPVNEDVISFNGYGKYGYRSTDEALDAVAAELGYGIIREER